MKMPKELLQYDAKKLKGLVAQLGAKLVKEASHEAEAAKLKAHVLLLGLAEGYE